MYLYSFLQCNNTTCAEVSVNVPGTYKYTLKLLYTQRKSEFSMRRLDSKCIFCSVDVPKDEIGRLVQVMLDTSGLVMVGKGNRN